MLKVTIELIPENGSAETAKVIGIMSIKNIIDDIYKDDYQVIANEFNNGIEEKPTEVKIKDHPHGKSQWGLVAKAARLVADNFGRRADRKK